MEAVFSSLEKMSMSLNNSDTESLKNSTLELYANSPAAAAAGDAQGSTAWWQLLQPCQLSTHADDDQQNVTTSQPYEEFFNRAQFITGLLLFPFICLGGIVGNSFAIAVVKRRKMTSTSIFLIALAIADLLKLLNDCLYIIVSVLFRTQPTHAQRMLGYMYPFSHYVLNQSAIVSAWLTVCIGLERYMLVCHIGKSREICNIPRAKRISICLSLALSLFAVPIAFRYTRVVKHDPVSNATYYDVTLSELGCSWAFEKIYVWCINLARSVLPLCILSLLNGLIIRELRRQRHSAARQINQKRNRITMMLIAVIIVFMICVTPDAIMSLVFNYGYYDANNLVKGIREYSDFMLALNSAVNFAIYCRFHEGFRITLKEVLRPCSCCWRGSTGLVLLRDNTHRRPVTSATAGLGTHQDSSQERDDNDIQLQEGCKLISGNGHVTPCDT